MTRRIGPPTAAVLAATAALLTAACGSGDLPPCGAVTLLTTASERAGEIVFQRENCSRCHTLLRPIPAGRIDWPPRPEAPRPWSRVGPDLAVEGHRHSDDWHYAHLAAPGIVVPGSPMPAYPRLFETVAPGSIPVPTGEGRDLVAYLQALGRGERDVYAEFRRIEAVVPPAPPEGVDVRRRGERLYGQHCGACHGERGDGRGAAAALLATPPRDLTAGRFLFKSTPGGTAPRDEDLYRAISLGTGIASAMPGFYWLPPEDRWALVLQVKRFGPESAAAPATDDRAEGAPTAAPPQEVGGAGRGRLLWADAGCASCHGEDGRGGPLAGRYRDPAGGPAPPASDLTHACRLKGGASAPALTRALTQGLGLEMPAYGEALPSRHDREALVAYLAALLDGDASSPSEATSPER